MPMFVNGNGSPFPTGTNPVSIATADLNGDGHLDLLTTNYISDNVSVLFGNGHGVFTPQTPVPVTNGPREVKVGDLDGDGDIDFLATNYSGNNVTIARNNGNGTLATTSVAVGTVPRGLAVGDLDRRAPDDREQSLRRDGGRSRRRWRSRYRDHQLR